MVRNGLLITGIAVLALVALVGWTRHPAAPTPANTNQPANLNQNVAPAPTAYTPGPTGVPSDRSIPAAAPMSYPAVSASYAAEPTGYQVVPRYSQVPFAAPQYVPTQTAVYSQQQPVV